MTELDTTTEEINTVPVYQECTTPNTYSIMFVILQFPILAFAGIFISINLILYTISRIYVSISERLLHFFSSHRRLKKKLKEAKSYKEWCGVAKKMDQTLSLEQWKFQPTNTPQFDESLLLRVTKLLQNHRTPQTINKLCSTLQNSACKNDLGGVETERLYSRCYYGTKNCVETYLNEVEKSLEYVSNSNEMTLKQKETFFKQVKLTYGRTALCLSGGATLSYFHFGVMKALFEAGQLPNIITGTSAGSLTAATICTRTDEELRNEVFVPELANRMKCCDDSFVDRIKALWKTGAMFSPDKFRYCAEWFCKGDLTFLEAYQKTGRILNISVVSTERHSKLKVLNYVNSPHVTIRSATVASSSIPGILPPCELYMKDSSGNIVPYQDVGRCWRDGSFRGDIPETELHQTFRVKYTVVSQVNPHISLFFYSPYGSAGDPSIYRSGKGWRGGFVAASIIRFFLLDLHKWLTFLRDMELLPTIAGANVSEIWLQSFEGSKTILPPFPSIVDFLNLIHDPSPERFDQFVRNGEIQTWPAISMITNRLRIERCIKKLSGKVKEQIVEKQGSVVGNVVSVNGTVVE